MLVEIDAVANKIFQISNMLDPEKLKLISSGGLE
jgi:hypothetical protein